MPIWPPNRGIEALIELASLVLIGVAVTRSTVNGRNLVIAGAIWLLVVVLGFFLWPSGGILGVKFNGRHRTAAIVIIYLCVWIYQFLLFGWLIPFGIGIYRVVRK